MPQCQWELPEFFWHFVSFALAAGRQFCAICLFQAVAGVLSFLREALIKSFGFLLVP